jgi:SPP1 gp7 family putative phage head morphogenesis protein
MAWRVSPQPLRFEEAVAWFRQKVILSEAEFRQLTEEARRRAFTVAGMAQTEVLAALWESLAQALEHGTPYEEWRRSVLPRLEAAWLGESSHRLKIIFQTNILSAYAAGRYHQLSDPDVLRGRPFWMFDAVLDSRTSEGCRGLNGLVLPATHPFWDRNYPPRHYGCRSGVRSLTRADAERRGVADAAPPAVADPGFGSRPRPEEWGYAWAQGVASSAASPRWEAALLGDPPGPADYGRPEALPLSPLPEGFRSLPAIADVGQETFLALLAKDWGGLERISVDPTGAGVILDARVLVEHLQPGSPDRRERFLNLLPDVVEHPSEIWLLPMRNDRGRIAFRKRYLKLYRQDETDAPILLVVEQQKGAAWTALTMIRARERQLNRQRVGFLLWPK